MFPIILAIFKCDISEFKYDFKNIKLLKTHSYDMIINTRMNNNMNNYF